MFLDELAKAVKQKKWWNRNTMNSILKIPTGWPQERFALLVELLSYKWALKYPRWNIKQTKINPKFIANELYKAAQYMQNPTILSATLRNTCEILSHEFKELKINYDAIKKWDIDKWIIVDKEFKNFNIQDQDDTEILITSQQDLKNAWAQKVDFVFKNITSEEQQNYLVGMNYIKALWVKIDMICAYHQEWDVMESKKIQECLEERLSLSAKK